MQSSGANREAATGVWRLVRIGLGAVTLPPAEPAGTAS